MIARATTFVSILRGEAADVYGDDEPTNATAYAHVPMSIIERKRRVFDQASQTPRIIRVICGRADPRTDIEVGDRILDEKNGNIYIVDSWDTPKSPVHAPDMEIDLRWLADNSTNTVTPRLPTT